MGFIVMEIEPCASSTKNNAKIGKVLRKFLEPNFKIKNDVYLNKFLTHLVGENEGGKSLEERTNKELKEIFCQWIIEASTLCNQKKGKPPPTILSFVLNLTSHLSVNEQIFVRLNSQNVYESLLGEVLINSMTEPNVTLSSVTLLCSFLEHKCGVQWVMATTYWADVIKLGLKAHTMFIRKKAYQFITKLLEKSICFNRNFAINLVVVLVKPLKDFFRTLPTDKSTQQALIENKEFFESLKPTLDFVLEVTETLLKRFNKNAMHLFIVLETPETMDRILLLSQSEDLSLRLLKIQFVFLFYKDCITLDGVKVVDHDSVHIYNFKTLFDLIKIQMDKNNVKCVIKICDYAHALFHCIAERLPLCLRKGEKVDFQIQMVMIQLMPLMSFGYQILTEKRAANLMLTDEFREDYLYRVMKFCAVQCIDMCYKFFESLKLKDDLIEDVILALQYIVKIKKLLSKEGAAVIFPLLVYAMNDALTVMHERPDVNLSSSSIFYLKTLVDTMVDVVETFDLTWKDSVETIHVMDLAYDFLQYQSFSDSMMIIKGLKLLNTAISKYMSPDMILLIYDKKDSKISLIGQLLYAKCHDSAWEIRDSALEVVCTLSINANTKFPAFTQILVEAELPQLVVRMALKDGEYYVRATAFKCLQELIQIPEISDILCNVDKFLENILNVFEIETEGIVRKEAAAFIYQLNKHQHFPVEMLPRLYDVMTHAAIGDLHWEVKYNALDFWINSWEVHLTHQGMIDRTFPSHTFSKEHRKIVALTEAEVRKRIIKVLHQLSHTGCLHVMKCAVQDDCDVEVSKKATLFTVDIVKLFRTYKIPCDGIDESQCQNKIVILQNHVLHQPVYDVPASPCSSTTLTCPSPADMGSLDNPQDINSLLDPLSPFPAPFSPSLNLDLITPSIPLESTANLGSKNIQDQLQNVNSIQQQELLGQNAAPRILEDRRHSTEKSWQDWVKSISDAANQMAPHITPPSSTYDVIRFASDGGTAQLENVINANSLDLMGREKVLDEFLNTNDMTLLQGIYNPIEEITNNTTEMKKKTYLAPSEFLKFVYNEVEAHAKRKTEWMDSLDEFDSLLDDILKEYSTSLNVNDMDCY